MKRFSISIFLTLLLLFVLSGCKDKKKQYDSDFIVKNTTQSQIKVYSNVYTRGSGGNYDLMNFTDYIEAGATYRLRNTMAKEDVDVSSVFYQLYIFQNDIQSSVDVLKNDRWVKARISDDKISYTLTVDPSFFTP